MECIDTVFKLYATVYMCVCDYHNIVNVFIQYIVKLVSGQYSQYWEVMI